MSALRTVITLVAFPLIVRAHMQMSSPYPINSPLDPVKSANVDYDYTSPLSSSGSDFPCKGFAGQTPFTSKATYQAGDQYQMTIAGTATHDGGSCQLSLSYDSGTTFKVIKSMIGGCPITKAYNFTIPEFAPSGNVLFAWSWFNVVGNREMYMDCAQVTIQGATPGRHRRAQWRRQTSMASLPDLFVADVNQPSQCTTIEGQDVQFPNPGSDVLYGTDSITPQPGNGFTCQNPSAVDAAGTDGTSDDTTTGANTLMTSNPSGTAASSAAGATDTSTTTVTPITTITNAASTPSVGSPTTAATVSDSASIASPSAASSAATSARPTASASSTPSGPCTPGTFACNSDTSFSQCVSSGVYVFMGSTADGTVCDDGQIMRDDDGACTPNGALVCGSNNFTFYLCDQGGLIDMGPVAAGTECINGEIVNAQ